MPHYDPLPYPPPPTDKERISIQEAEIERLRDCCGELKQFMMASCDSADEREEAKALGWATFRIKKPEDEKLPGEVTCPASAEAGKKMTCYNCGLCRGGDTLDVTINMHGRGFRNFQKHA